MRKLKVFMAACALMMGAGQTWGQMTDVTSTYIVNPSFELGKTGEAFTSAESGAYDAPYSWTTDTNFPTSGTRNFGIFKNDGKTPSNFGKAVEPAEGTYYYLGRNSWASSLVTSLTQTSKTSMPEGTYILDIAYKLGTNTSNGATNGTLKLGVKQSSSSLGESESEKSVSANNTYFNTASWSRMAVPFTVTTTGTVDFVITFNFNPSVANTPQEAIIIDDVRLYDLNTASEVNGIDVSGLVKNNNFNGSTEGWTSTTSASSNKLASNKSGAITGNFYENWKNSPFTGKISQTITGIPNGVYKLTVASFFNQATAYPDHVKVFANSETENITAQETPELFSVYADVTSNSLEIGINKVSSEGESGDNWIGIDNVALVYYGDEVTIAQVKLASYIATYNSTLNEAKAFTEPSMFESDWTALQGAISTNTLDLNDPELTESDLTTATSNLNAAISAANIAVAKKTTYDTAVSTINGGTNVDLTSLLTNPGFELGNTSGWTNDGSITANAQNNTSFDNKQGTYYAERWHVAGTVDINQTVALLPAGIYKVEAYMYSDVPDAKLYVNSENVSVSNSRKYQAVVTIADKGSIKIGASCTLTDATWICMDDFKLTYLAANIAELPYTLATGKMGTDKATAQTTAEATFTSNPTMDNYNALLTAITEAEASVANYAKLKAAIDKANDVLEANNFVTAAATTALENEISTATAAWTDVTYTDAEATAEIATLGTTVSGWHAIDHNGKAGAFMASAWGKDSENWWDAPYINTWSTEGDNDGSGFSVPFFEYYDDANKNLAAKTMTATLTGLDNGCYDVEIWARVQRRSDADFNADNSMITMNVNGGEKVSIMSNTSNNVGTGGSTMRLGRYTARGMVTDGTLTLSIEVKLGANVHWLSWRDVKYTKVADESITVSDAGFATYVSDNDLDYSDVTGLKAYKATVAGNTITFSPVTTVPAGEGVLLKAAEGSYNIPVTTGVSWTDDYNAFIRGTGATVPSEDGDNHNYILNKVEGVVGFYKANGQTVAANRAYIQTTTNAARLNISFDDDDQTTGIARVEETVANDAVYTLSGVRVEKPTKGLYIKNGKKVVIK